MIIERTVGNRAYAEEAAKVLGVQSSLVQVTIARDYVEVTARDKVDSPWKDVPADKVASLTTWGDAVLAEAGKVA